VLLAKEITKKDIIHFNAKSLDVRTTAPTSSSLFIILLLGYSSILLVYGWTGNSMRVVFFPVDHRVHNLTRVKTQILSYIFFDFSKSRPSKAIISKKIHHKASAKT
jgi:hypothetical protein